jgi:tRNA-2-methylthio-N6-dimethylallyladenosine synthase
MKQGTYHIVTFGCQMNKNDSERMEALLQGLGMRAIEDVEKADFVVLNSCSVRKSAEDRIFGKIKTLSKIKAKRPEMILAVTGCMPGRDRDRSFKKHMPALDLYFPTADMGQLPRWIGELRPELVNSTDLVEDYLKLKPERHSVTQAFVSVQTGCNKFCSYCVVPFARGLEKNRAAQDLLEEIRDLAEHGCVEVTLLGQTVNSYQAPDPECFSKDNPYSDQFAALLWEVNQIKGITRLHYTAPHPVHMNDEIIDAMTLPAHLNFIHLPVQSGDDEVLRRMNRRYTAEEFLVVIEKIKAKIPSIAIGTDIIVGFSGETNKQFEQTVELYKKVGFDISYTAQYSQRSGTAAERAFPDDVPHEEKKRRWVVLQELMEDLTFEKNKLYKDEIVSVLVERHEPPKVSDEMMKMPEKVKELLENHPGYCYGNSRELKLVRFKSDESMVGKIVDVKITRTDKWLLEGVLV